MSVEIKVRSEGLTTLVDAANAMADAIEGFIEADRYSMDQRPNEAIEKMLVARAIFLGVMRKDVRLKAPKAMRGDE